MVAILADDLTKRFHGKTVVDRLALSVQAGEIFALLGQNGAGKTTTIRMLSCLMVPDEGDALIHGHSVRQHPDEVKSILAVSPQESAVAAKLTAKENLVFMASIYGASKKLANEKAQVMLERFGLSDRAGDRAKTLSGGMRQRLSIAMALISEPKILFLDEPTLGLDVRSRRDLWNKLMALKGNTTVLLTTHSLDEAEALADHIGILHHGRMLLSGTAEQIKHTAGQESLENAFLKLTEDERGTEE